MGPRTILYTGKGGVGKTSVAAATARRCAAAGLRTVVLSTDPAHSLSDSLEAELGADPTPAGANLFGQEVQAQEEMERHWDSVQTWLGVAARGARRGPDRRRGADRAARHGRAVLAAVDQAPPRGGRVRLRDRRLRTDRRDAAAALVPGRRHLVARADPAVAAAPGAVRAHALRPAAAGRRRVRRRRAPGAQPGRDERHPARPLAHVGAARDEPRPHGGEGGDADLHLPQPVRLSDRRGRGEPAAALRGLLRRMERGAGRAARPGALGVRARAGADRALHAARGRRRRDARPAGRRGVRRHRPGRAAAHRAGAGAGHRQRPRDAAGERPVRREGRAQPEEDRDRGDRPRGAAKAHYHAAAGPRRLLGRRRPLRGRHPRDPLREARR